MSRLKVTVALALVIVFLIVTIVVVITNMRREQMKLLVVTNAGSIKGVKATDGDYNMFLGIPYAKVDENNPFGPSTPHPKFEKEFVAIHDAVKCPQIEHNIVMGSLDCLQLNVYVPNTASSENLLPVMIFFHGGNFEIGHTGRDLYGPKFIVRHDVILVTLNYRLGPYGLMCLHIPEVPGNQAFRDQLIGLRWIKENIQAFGGDNDSVTLFGESAGARSADIHLLSPQEKLFHKVILQSTTSIGRNMLAEPDLTTPMKIAEQLGFVTNDLYKAISFLSTVNSTLVVGASNFLGLTFQPCLEKDFNGVEKIIEDYPINAVKSIEKVKDMPILIGYNDNEYVALYANKDPEYFEDLKVTEERLVDNFDFDSKKSNDLEQIVRRFYIGDEKSSVDVMWELIDFDSDFTYNHPVERSINVYMNNAAGDIFYYVYSYTGERDYFKDYNNVSVGGAAHADELGYLFDMAQYGTPSTEDQLIIDRITTLWTNFAKYSDPTPETTELLPVRWEPVTKKVRNYMTIDTEMSAGKRPFHKRMAFWDLFYFYNWNFQKGYRETNS